MSSGFIRITRFGRHRNAVTSGHVAPVIVGLSAISGDTNSPNALVGTPASPGLAVNDVLVTHISVVGSASVITMPAGEGWVLSASATSSDNNATCAVAYKRWGVGFIDVTTSVFTGTGGNMRAVMQQIRGCKTTGNPFTTAIGLGGDVLSDTAIAPIAQGGSSQLVMRYFTAQRSLARMAVVSPTSSYGGASFAWTVGVDGACCSGYAVSNSDPVGTSLAAIS